MQNENTTKCIMDDLIPVAKWDEYFKFPSKAAIRMMIFYAEINRDRKSDGLRKYEGFNKVIVRIGKRVYISISSFNEWVKQQNIDYV